MTHAFTINGANKNILHRVLLQQHLHRINHSLKWSNNDRSQTFFHDYVCILIHGLLSTYHLPQSFFISNEVCPVEKGRIGYQLISRNSSAEIFLLLCVTFSYVTKSCSFKDVKPEVRSVCANDHYPCP